MVHRPLPGALGRADVSDRGIKVQGCQNLAIPAGQRFQQSGKSVERSDCQGEPKQEACIDLVYRSLPLISETRRQRSLSSPAVTWGVGRRQVLLACLPGIMVTKLGDLVLRPTTHDQAYVRLHGVSMLASEERSGCPPVSPLSMTRCFPELWVMTQRRIRRCARPPMSLRNSARRRGVYKNTSGVFQGLLQQECIASPRAA